MAIKKQSQSEVIGRVPPQNVEAEQSVLGSLLLDKEAIIKIADQISSEDFYQEDHSIIYSAVLVLFEKRKPIDLITLTDYLDKEKKLEQIGGASYLTTLVNSVPSSAHVKHYADIVHNKAMLRRLISAANNILSFSFNEMEEIDTVLDKAESELYNVSQKFTRQYFTPIKSVLTDTFDRIDELHKHKGKLHGVPTGFAEMDNLLAGLQPSDLIILAARPSMGKTALAINIAQNAAIKNKIPVGVFSLEQSKEQLVDRLICGESGIDGWKMRTGRLSDNDFPKIGHAMGVLSEAPIYIDDSPMLNIMEIRTKARRLQSEHGLGLIIVDYLQLMQGRQTSRDTNRVQEISEISRGLKQLAREINVPVIALSQLSRAVEHRDNKQPMLADLRESGCLTGDTLIYDSDNGVYTPIKNLIGSNFTCLTKNKNDKLIPKKAEKIFSTGRKKVFQLKLASGKEIEATGNHQFLTVNGWVPLDHLKLNVMIATPRVINFPIIKGNIFSNEKIILLAHLIGDGCYLKRQPLHYTNSDRLCLNIVDQSAKTAFFTKNRWVKQKNWYHIYLSAPYKLTHSKRNPIVKWLDEELKIFDQHSGEKIIPEVIFGLPKEKLSLFIKHLFATDGSLTKSSGSWRLYYASKSKELINSLQSLLLRFGIHSRIKINRKEGYEPVYNLYITGKDNQLIFLKEIGIFGKKEKNVKLAIKDLNKISANTNIDVIPKEIWSKIAQKFQQKGMTTRIFHQKMGWSYSGTQRYKNGISRLRLAKIAKVLKDEELMDLAISDIFWDKIVQIKPQGIKEVYDITVPITHNFVANNIVVHNSIEQDADIVMFIYREDYYNQETERKNIADILVRKHRNGPIGQFELYFIPEQTRFRSIEHKREA